MKFKSAIFGTSSAKPRRGPNAFTLVEVLAALLFMAIVIPVAVKALQIASRAGVVSQRKAVAARIAERVLNEMIVTTQFQGTSLKGVINEAQQDYEWTLRSEPWPQDALLLVSVEVDFPVQGRQYDVVLSTLYDNSATNSVSSTNSAGSGMNL
jgi:type II secretory pathway pseudopilin PulG